MRDLSVSSLPSVLLWGALVMSRYRRFASYEKLGKKKKKKSINRAQYPYISGRPLITASSMLIKKRLDCGLTIGTVVPCGNNRKWYLLQTSVGNTAASLN